VARHRHWRTFLFHFDWALAQLLERSLFNRRFQKLDWKRGMKLSLPHVGCLDTFTNRLAKFIVVLHDEDVIVLPVIHDGWEAIFVHAGRFLEIDLFAFRHLEVQAVVCLEKALLKCICSFEAENSITIGEMARIWELKQASIAIIVPPILFTESKNTERIKKTRQETYLNHSSNNFASNPQT
jgi:hypothetical protein